MPLFSSATPLNRAETGLLLGAVGLFALAVWGPVLPASEHQHAFADQRAWLGIPCALDVLSNLPFALAGVWGLVVLRRVAGIDSASRWLAALFFSGLLCTAAGSMLYHGQPHDAGLLWDRLGMVLPFAGLLGLAATSRVSERAGWAMAGAVLLAGPLAVAWWAHTGNLLPWAVLQGGGMLLIVLLALRKPLTGAWGLPLASVIAWYVLAKALELGDHQVFDLTHGLVSGHTLKHVAAAMAAWPVISLMHNVAQARPSHALPGNPSRVESHTPAVGA